MTLEMVSDAAMAIRPEVLYPHHFGDTDVSRLKELLENKDIQVRIREMR